MTAKAIVWRVLKWIGVGSAILVAAVIVIPIGWLVIGIPENQRLKKEMGEFCSSFHPGSPIAAAEVIARAEKRGYQTRMGSPPPGSQPGEASTVVSTAHSPTGTTWICTVQLQNGQARAANFRGISLAN